MSVLLGFLAVLSLPHIVASHASIFHPAMYGFNATGNFTRPLDPLMGLPFSQWWFHGHLKYPPHPEDVVELAVGKPTTLQIACTKSATTYYASSRDGGNIQNPDRPNDVCPGAPPAEYHTTGFNDLAGCALAISYKSDALTVQPEDFTIFSINDTCVWYRYTDFQVPAAMPPCPNGMCTCAFFWIHAPDSGAEQMYMNGFQCNVTGSTSTTPIGQCKVPRRCGADPAFGKPDAVPGNCTYGPKCPMYWLQLERNNMPEGNHAPPLYNKLYGFEPGAQSDIFEGYYESIPVPGPNQTELPVRRTGSLPTPTGASGGGTIQPSTPGAAGGTSLSNPSSIVSSAGGATPSATDSSGLQGVTPLSPTSSIASSAGEATPSATDSSGSQGVTPLSPTSSTTSSAGEPTPSATGSSGSQGVTLLSPTSSTASSAGEPTPSATDSSGSQGATPLSPTSSTAPGASETTPPLESASGSADHTSPSATPSSTSNPQCHHKNNSSAVSPAKRAPKSWAHKTVGKSRRVH